MLQFVSVVFTQRTVVHILVDTGSELLLFLLNDEKLAHGK